MRTTASVVLVTALALGACGRREETREAPPPPPAPAAPAAPKAPAAPVAFKRKAGLWEMQMSMGGVDFVQKSQVCVKAGEDDTTVFNPQSPGSDACSRQAVSRQADGWRFQTVCDMGSGGKLSVAGVAAGDFDKHYQVRSEMTVSGAAVPQMNRTTTMTVEARRIGDC